MYSTMQSSVRTTIQNNVFFSLHKFFRAGEEKEVAVEQLQVERLEFEHRMKDLHHQMDGITQERENILTISREKSIKY